GPCRGYDAIDAGPAIRRFETDDAALRRWQAHRPGGVGAQRRGTQAGRDRDPRATAGAARNVRRIPWIPNGAELDVGAGPTVRKLVQVGFTDEYGPRIRKAADDRCVLVRHPARQDTRTRGGAQATRGNVVLD